MDAWIRRLHALPLDLQKLIIEDMKTAFKNRIKAMERINDAKKRNT